jgi:hypothetical protein
MIREEREARTSGTGGNGVSKLGDHTRSPQLPQIFYTLHSSIERYGIITMTHLSYKANYYYRCFAKLIER